MQEINHNEQLTVKHFTEYCPEWSAKRVNCLKRQRRKKDMKECKHVRIKHRSSTDCSKAPSQTSNNISKPEIDM